VEQVNPPINERTLLGPEPPNQVVTINLRVEYVTLQCVLLNVVHRSNRSAPLPEGVAESRIPEMRIDQRRYEDHDGKHQYRDLPVEPVSYRRHSFPAGGEPVEKDSTNPQTTQCTGNRREINGRVITRQDRGRYESEPHA